MRPHGTAAPVDVARRHTPHRIPEMYPFAHHLQHSRRFVVWLSVLALLQMTLMSWLPGAMGSKESAWVEMCVSQGARSSLVQEGDPENRLPAAHSNQHCPLCSNYVPLLDALNTAGIVVPTLSLGQQFVAASLLAPRTILAWCPHTARAPPVSSSFL